MQQAAGPQVRSRLECLFSATLAPGYMYLSGYGVPQDYKVGPPV